MATVENLYFVQGGKMEHKMDLYERHFNNILTDSKTIEIRLNDEIRQKITVGDYIIFYKLPLQEEKVKVKVVGLYPYSKFKELFEAFPSSEFGFPDYTIQQMFEIIYSIYTKELEEQCGVLGIHIKRIV